MTKSFKVDENLPGAAVHLLRDHGFDASSVGEQGHSGFADARIFEICAEEGRAVLTLDLDFSDLRSFPVADSPGIIVMRLPSQDKASVIAVLTKLLPLLDEQDLASSLWIVEPTRVRIRTASE